MSTSLKRREWILQCLQSASVLALLPETLAAADWTPHFLSTEQNTTLTAIGEAIVPGSTTARCHQVIDAIISIESSTNQAALKSALDAFAGFASKNPAEQSGILSAASTSGNPLEPHFRLIKEWVADTYWSSEQGLKELGWNGQLAWANYPGCESHRS